MNKLLLTLSAIVSILLCAPSARAADDFGLLIFNHQIAIGMTFGNVQAAWGKPEKVDRSVYSSGVREYWFFNNGAMVVFDQGRVTSFHQ
jgi:hypothetical protein